MRFDLSDEEWSILEPLMLKSRKSARPHDRRIINAIFYVLRTGIPEPSQAASDRAPRPRWPDRIPARLQDGPRGHRVERAALQRGHRKKIVMNWHPSLTKRSIFCG